MMRKLLLCTLILPLFAGCAAFDIKPTEVPSVETPKKYRSAPPATKPISLSYWNDYGDPEIPRLVAQALKYNSDIGIAVARVRSARAMIMAARSQWFPQVNGTGDTTRSRNANTVGRPTINWNREAMVEASWEIDLFGKIADRVGAARADFIASQAARDSVMLSVSAEVADAYLSLRGYDAELNVTRMTLATRLKSLRLSEARFKVGYTTRLEVLQAQSEYDSTAQMIPALQQSIAQTENALSELVGDMPHAIERGASLDSLHPPGIPQVLPSQLLSRRPDVAEAEYQLVSADRGLSAARKEFLPSINLSANIGVTTARLIADPQRIWTIAGSVLAPIFEGGRIAAQVEGQAAAVDAAAWNYRGVALTAFKETNDALNDIIKLREQLAIIRSRRDALAAAYDLSVKQYMAGYSNYLDQLDTQRNLYSAEMNLVETQTQLLQANVALYKALGGGWTRQDIEAMTEARDISDTVVNPVKAPRRRISNRE